MAIHPTALIGSDVRVDDTCEIGPFCVLEGTITLGPHNVLGPHVTIYGTTHIGEGNRFHAGVSIGDAPQSLAYQGAEKRTSIGNGNVFREHVTVHGSFETDGCTRIGNGGFFMACSHIAHDCQIADNVIMANGALAAGHAHVGERVFFSGNAGIHQFSRVGRLVMLRGQCGVTKDVPPFMIAADYNRIGGINTVGLQRSGFDASAIRTVKELYKIMYRRGLTVSEALNAIASAELGPLADEMIAFLQASKRGVIWQIL